MAILKTLTFLIIVICITLAGCASKRHNPKSHHAVPSFSNTKVKEIGKVTITASVLSDEDSMLVFGVPTVSRGVEVVWIEIENNDEIPYITFPIEIDGNYYSPSEAARKTRYPLDDPSVSEVNEYFHRNELSQFIPPGETTSGFIYSVPDIGIKEFTVKILGPGTLQRAHFVFAVPGIKVDFEDLVAEELYDPEEIVDLNEDTLRGALEEFQCCTTNKEKSGDGDPLNMIVIGEFEEFLPYFIERGWQVTEDIYLSSIYKEILAFFFGSTYNFAPVSSLYVFDRGQDIALQKPRETIYRRNHLRLWLSPYKFEGTPIWIGQISRDIGVSFSTKNWWLSNHDIDQEVDEARNFIMQDMMMSGGVERFGYVRGMEPALEDSPMKNFMDQPIYTDGLRVIFLFSPGHVDITETRIFNWEWPDIYVGLKEYLDAEELRESNSLKK